MSSSVATIAYSLLISVLFFLDRDRMSHVSSALWIPMAWLCISASRTVAQWLEMAPNETLDSVYEGSPLDALIFAGLITAGLIVLLARRKLVRTFLRKNWPLLVLFFYCGVSILWSDFPLVAFKRWIKGCGNLVMVLVVLTDPDPAAAIKRLLVRSGFLLIPLSVLLIRYYPSLGMSFSSWTGMAYFSGVSTGKNGLGFVCFIFGLGSLWRVLSVFQETGASRKTGSLIAHGAVLLLTFWLFRMADSATSLACFLVGAVLIAVMGLPGFVRKQTGVHFLVGAILIGAFYGLVLSPEAGLTETVGRSSTLTGRTELWDELLSTNKAPFFGVGYESFWLGERIERIWQSGKVAMGVNQAHNGYIEVFLNLGWVGVVLLCFVIAWGYRNVLGWFRRDAQAGRLRLAYFVGAILYNITEAAFFEIHPVWIAFLLAVVCVPEPEHRNVYLGEDAQSTLETT